MEVLMNSNSTSVVVVPYCREVNEINASEQCSFILNQPDCHSDIGYVNYLSFMYCSFGPGSSMQTVAFAILWLLVLFVGLGVTANDFLCPALFVISKNLRLSQNVAGVTLLAFGNGAPDIFSALAGIRQGKTDLVIGGLVGAGIFVTTVVAGSIFLSQSFRMMKRPFLRDVTFYLVAASWAFYLFNAGSIQLFHAVGFMALYLLYIVVVVISRIIHQKHSTPTKAESSKEEKEKEAEAHGSQVEDVEAQQTTTFDGSDEKDDPEIHGVVLKSFCFYNNGFKWDEETNSPPEDFEPPTEIYILPDPAVEEGSSGRKLSRGGSCKESTKEVCKKESLIPVKEHSEVKLLLEKVSPIDMETWSEKTWFNHAVELIKSPILLSLTLTTPIVDYRVKMNNWCRSLTLIHCFTGPLFILFATGNGTVMLGGVMPLVVIVLVISIAVFVAVFFTSTNTQIPRYHTVLSYLGFAVSVVWIYIISIEIVVLLQAIGIVFNLSDTLIGLTILAWGNCLLDFMSNVSVAKKGFPRMGIAACFGSPFLTLLMGVGVPCAIQLFGDLSLPGVPLKFSPLVVVLFSTLGISLVSTLVSMVASRFMVKRPYGVYLIALYFTFLVIAILVEIGVISM